MSAETQTAKGHIGESRRWCCGQPRPEDTLVHWAIIPKSASASAVSISCGAGPGTAKPP